MNAKLSKSLFVLFLAIVCVIPVFSQRQTGSLHGKVLDTDDNPLPGVTLTISSSALLGTRDFVTADTGSFRFISLPPGVYALKCVLPGFKILTRDGLIVSVGKATRLQIIMETSPVEENVLVTAASPVVDVKSSKMSITYTKDLFTNIPLNRSIFNMVQTMPGTVTESGDQTSFHGSPISQNQISLDGLTLSEGTTGHPTFEPDLSIVEEIEVEVGAHPAEVGGISGGFVNIVTRSGGNDFHGEATAYYFAESMVDKNLSEEQLDALGLSSPAFPINRSDFSASLGGPIFKDKLWFFIAGNHQNYRSAVSGFPQDQTGKQWYGLGKLTLQLNDDIKLMGYFNYKKTRDDYNQASYVRLPEATANITDRIPDVNAQLSWVLSPNSFLDLRWMWIDQKNFAYSQPEATWQNYDRGTGMYSGGWRFDQYSWRIRKSLQASYTLFLDDFLGGDHELKLGGSYEQIIQHTSFWNDSPLWSYSRNGSPYYFGGISGMFYALGMAPTEAESNAAKTDQRANIYNFYIQDSWTIKDRLTLNIGLRYEHTSGSLPAQSVPEVPYWLWLDPVYFSGMDYPEAKNFVVFKGLQPRLGLVYDIFGTGKTTLKASFSRYNDPLLIRSFKMINPNGWGMLAMYWMDLNVNGEYDQADFFMPLASIGRVNPDSYNIADYVNPDQKTPYWNEFIVGIDHELFPNFRLGLSYIYKSQKNIWDIEEKNRDLNWTAQHTVTDPGYDGAFGTADDGQLTLYDRSRPLEPDYLTNVEEAYRKYHGIELVLEKRMSNRWQFLGSVVFSKNWGTMGNYYGASIGSSYQWVRPNFIINRDGRLDTDRPLVVKLQGTYQLPYGINISAYFIHSSGTPFARSVSVWLPNYSNYETILAETPGTRRNPGSNIMHLRLEKEFLMGSIGRLGFFLDVYNLFNSVQIYTSTSFHGYIEADGSFSVDPNWQKVIGVSDPRYMKLGVRFTF